MFERARGEYQRVAAAYERGELRNHTLAAQSYLGLGVVYDYGAGDTGRAAEYYRQALAIAAR